MSLFFNILCRFVLAFLWRSKHLLISWLQSLSAMILEFKKIKSITASTLSPSIHHEVMGSDAMINTRLLKKETVLALPEENKVIYCLISLIFFLCFRKRTAMSQGLFWTDMVGYVCSILDLSYIWPGPSVNDYRKEEISTSPPETDQIQEMFDFISSPFSIKEVWSNSWLFWIKTLFLAPIKPIIIIIDLTACLCSTADPS